MKSFVRMSYPYILWIGIFVVAPMFMILLYALTRGGNSTLTFHFCLQSLSTQLQEELHSNHNHTKKAFLHHF